MTGTQVAHYRILDKIGEGGMGVVYRARDLKLERDVALKFLPPHALGHAGEHERLLQEARAASALAHPHVCVIHAIEEHAGQPFIVMEYVEGTTLRERIASGSLPLSTAMDWAIQVAEALAEAHARGIVHRDIKSENVMITLRGQVKVMDFGLARLRGASHATRTTSTVGTLGYMAPEQIRDGISDARSDIFSFGVVLYEMLAGRLPFHADRDAGLMYAILNEDPEPIQKFRPELGSEHLHLLHRMLEKDPEDRYQSVSDVLIDLRRIKRDSQRVSRRPLEAEAAGRAAAGAGALDEPGARGQADGAARASSAGGDGRMAPAAASTTASSGGGRRRRTASIAVAIAVVAALAIAALLMPRGAPRLNPDMTFRVLSTPVSQLFYPGMSPDGRWIAFPGAAEDGRGRLFFMNTRGGEVREIFADPDLNVFYADVSPDGDRIAFNAYNSRIDAIELCVVPSLGGARRTLAVHGQSPRWTPDGKRVGYVLRDSRLALWTVPAEGGTPRLEFRDTLGLVGRYSYSFSPDGRSIAWLRTFPGRWQELIVRDLASGRERQLTRDRANIDEVFWTRQNTIIYSSNRSGATNLWMVPARGGAAAQITKGTGPDIAMRVSDDGRTLLYLQQQPVHRLWLTRATGPGATPVTQDDLVLGEPALSPDGSTIAVAIHDPDPLRKHSRFVLMDRNGGNRRVLFEMPGEIQGANWSPDGRSLSFTARSTLHPDSLAVYLVDAVPGATPRMLSMPARFAVWHDSLRLLIERNLRTYLLDVRDGSLSNVSPESMVVFGRPGVAHQMVWDLHANRVGPWLRLLRAPGDSVGELRRIPGGLDVLDVSRDLDYALFVQADGSLLRVELPSLRQRKVTDAFTGVRRGTNLRLRDDGVEGVVRETRLTSKLILVENFR